MGGGIYLQEPKQIYLESVSRPKVGPKKPRSKAQCGIAFRTTARPAESVSRPDRQKTSFIDIKPPFQGGVRPHLEKVGADPPHLRF